MPRGIHMDQEKQVRTRSWTADLITLRDVRKSEYGGVCHKFDVSNSDEPEIQVEKYEQNCKKKKKIVQQLLYKKVFNLSEESVFKLESVFELEFDPL